LGVANGNSTTTTTTTDIGVDKEVQLKNQIQELLDTLEKVNSSANEREKQSSELNSELRQANGLLIQRLEATKKKYDGRIRKMEEQILAIMHRHSTQIKL
jgi:ElaB/YqjD/DUF883 family membrane-anchored ribosome-binding protein